MIKQSFKIGLFLFVLFLSQDAMAEGGTLQNLFSLKFGFGALNFFLMLFILYLLMRKAIPEYFSSRSLQLKMQTEEAKKLYDKSFRHFEEIEAKLQNADVEGKALIEKIKKQADEEKQRIVAEAKSSAEKILADAERIAEQEMLRASKKLKAEAIKIATGIAREKIEKDISQDDHMRLSGQFIDQVEKVSAQ